METTRIQSNQVERIYFILLDATGNPVTGLTGNQLDMLVLMRKSDGAYWDGSAWQASKTNLAATEQDAAASPGLYYYATPALAEDEYVITVSTTYAANIPQAGIIKAGGYVDEITDTRRIVKNKLTINAAASKLQLWDDNGTSVLYEWPLTDIDGNTVNIGAGAPANRGEPA